uniref:Phorbol-ester/DAG-type domain-containing protein n=1 Tax=Meloidogyne hapla TaxID=6305 RepID=A0A1I8BQX8_MELHA
MAILKVSELRRIIARQPIGSPVHLPLQGKGPEQKEGKNIRSIDHKRGLLLFQCSFHQRSLPPLLQFNNQIKTSKEQQKPLDFNNLPQYKNKSPTRSSSKKSSIPSSLGSLKRRTPKPVQQHYIYNVTEDRLNSNNVDNIEKAKQLQRQLENEKQIHYGMRATTATSDEESLMPKQSFDTANAWNSPERQIEQKQPIYSTINNSQIRKTISDSNALLFKYEQNGNNRKQSAPGTPQTTQREEEKEEIKQHEGIQNGVNNDITQSQHQSIISDHQKRKPSKEINDPENANDAYDHLFNGMRAPNAAATAATHPAMEIFRLPTEKETSVTEDADELRRRAKDRERQARGRKERRNFFEQIRARLSGPLRLFPRRHSQRAKSLDDYEQHLEEAAISTPQSRDQSQQRKASSGGFHEEHIRQQRLIQSAGPSSMATSTANLGQNNVMSRSHSQSQLILELIGPEEEGPTYYAIPAEISNEPAVVKLMQSGKKLHIRNSHILVASKSRGRVICSVCNKRIGGNFSTRQAYQCRDCRIVCHKNCHQQIDWTCENSTSISNLHVEEVDWAEFLRHHQLREFISVGNL